MWEPTCGHHAKKRAELLPRADMMSNRYFPGMRLVVSKSWREESVHYLAVSQNVCAHNFQNGSPAEGLVSEVLSSPFCENRDFHKGKIWLLDRREL